MHGVSRSSRSAGAATLKLVSERNRIQHRSALLRGSIVEVGLETDEDLKTVQRESKMLRQFEKVILMQLTEYERS